MIALLWSLVAALSVTATAPATRIEPPALVAPDASSCPQWYGTALDAGWPADQWATLDHVMWRESRCDPGATHHNANGTTDRGLVQINSVHAGWLAQRGVTLSALLDPVVNLTAALWLWQGSGWAPWRT